MSDATTPANPTDQIVATPAVLSRETPIVPAIGTKRVPDDSEAAVVQDAQRWRNDLQRVYEGDFGSESKSFKRLAAYIERLEAECDALLTEHEAYKVWDTWQSLSGARAHAAAHDNAERVIRG